MQGDRERSNRPAAVQDALASLLPMLRRVKYLLDFTSGTPPQPKDWAPPTQLLAEVAELLGDVGAGLQSQLTCWRDNQHPWDPIAGNACDDAASALNEVVASLASTATASRDAAAVLCDLPQA